MKLNESNFCIFSFFLLISHHDYHYINIKHLILILAWAKKKHHSQRCSDTIVRIFFVFQILLCFPIGNAFWLIHEYKLLHSVERNWVIKILRFQIWKSCTVNDFFFVGYFKNWFHYSNKKRNEWNYNQSIIDIDKLICYKSWSIMRITKIFKRHHTTLVTKKVLLDKKWESRSSFSNEYDDDDIMIFDDDQAQSKPNHNHHNTNNIH